jgi:hypothetical protein
MHIDWLVPARYAEVKDDGTMCVDGGGVDTLVVEQSALMPTLEIFLAIRVAAVAEEWLRSHTVEVTLIRETASMMTVYRERLRVPEARLLEPTRDIGVLIAARCQWQSMGSEELRFALTLDEEHVAEIPISVLATRQPKPRHAI